LQSSLTTHTQLNKCQYLSIPLQNKGEHIMAQNNLPTTNEIQIEILQQELNNLVYLNEDTMIIPFDDYQEKRNKLETQIKQLTETENK
jgi:hypothetical protein